MVRRIFVEKKPGLDQEASGLLREARELLEIKGLEKVRLLNRYDAEGMTEELFSRAVNNVFSEPQVDNATEKPDFSGAAAVFAVEYLPGQFDQRADSAAQCVQLISQGERPLIRSARVYALYGSLTDKEIGEIKKYVINPVEAREASLEKPETIRTDYAAPGEVAVLTGFSALDRAGLEAFVRDYGLAMDAEDIAFCQKYFREEGREPTITEIRMLDTYWSDHCRHTTFLTRLDSVSFEDPEAEKAWGDYLKAREELGRTAPICLMDLATTGVRYLKAKGQLSKLDESDEINACTVKVEVEADGKKEPWLLLFKNETHNHPTEIEPFGGAATCIGGAIRDPLSGRAYVYGAMRVTGAADPTVPVSETLPGKLPQRKLVTTAAAGYSSYGNQIGLATGIVDEIYHPGYAAKRMEIGAVIAAAPAENVRRETPAPGDAVILLGGGTGRDGIGGATGSSKAHNTHSVETCGAEVQKGNAPEERKLQRLFRNPEATKLIKRCNDFGAGGVSVAIGELADGLDIDLNAVPKKYEGLDGTELAISESQERMAVVVAPEDTERFLALADTENLQAVKVAEVTGDPRLVMRWNGKKIVDISRAFLNTNGAEKHTSALVEKPGELVRRRREKEESRNGKASAGSSVTEKDERGGTSAKTVGKADTKAAGSNRPKAVYDGASYGKIFADGAQRSFPERLMEAAEDLNICSRRGLSERFDSTIGAGTVLMPFGGSRQLTPAQAMVQKVSMEKKNTDDCSLMAWGYNPDITEYSPYRGAYLAVIESVSKLIASGAKFEDVYLTFQEYFARPGTEPGRWGQPLGALLGAFKAQMDLGIASIGGKDSMSGSFEDLDVPPTLVSFAVTMAKTGEIVSPEFKAAGHRVILLEPEREANGLPRAESLKEIYDIAHELTSTGKAAACFTPGRGGLAAAVMKSCMGNGLGFAFEEGFKAEELFAELYGGLVLEIAEEAAAADLARAVNPEEEKNPVCAEGGEKVPVCAESGNTEGFDAGGKGSFFCRELGRVTGGNDPAISLGAESVSMAELEKKYEDRLEKVYACNIPTAEGKVETFTAKDGGQASAAAESVSFPAPAVKNSRPRVLIPTFPGTNCEYDSARAVEEAGGEARIIVINNRSAESVARSVERFAGEIAESRMIFIPGGFSGGDEPDGSGKFITAFFRNEEVKEGVTELLERRDGLMLGICNGFQALIKLGLVPYGKIIDVDENCPTLTFNIIGRHQSRLVRTRVADNRSPFLRGTRVGEVFTVPISHGEGRFLASEELIRELAEKGQIATQYVDDSDRATMEVRYNPNGSMYAIEGITSPDGRVFGKMGHSERVGAGLYKNVPGKYDMHLFTSAMDYLRK